MESSQNNRTRLPPTFDLFFCDCPRRLFYIVLGIVSGLVSLILIIIIIVTCNKHKHQDGDHYIFARQWPPAICNGRIKCTPMAKELDRWTIHGLWPNDKNNTQKLSCSQDEFDIKTLSSIEMKLQNSWPDLYKNDSVSFWQKEWNKHGTCSNMPQLEYFDQTLALNDLYPLTQWLQNSKVEPGKEYSKENVLQALSSHFPSNSISFHCSNSNSKVVYLREIRFCFVLKQKVFEPIDCVHQSSCQDRFLYKNW